MMAPIKKSGLAPAGRVVAKSSPKTVERAPIRKGSALAKSPFGKIALLLLDVPAHKIKVWPVPLQKSGPKPKVSA
jgi:hypothetical protein